MALQRSYLKSLGLEGDKIDSIIEAHADTVSGLTDKITAMQTENDALKSELAGYSQAKTDLEKANATIKSLREATANNEGVVTERDQLKTEVDTLKSQIEDFTTKEASANTELTSLREQLAAFETDKNTATAEAERLKNEFDAFKAQIETDKANAAKRDAVRTALRNGGVARSDFQDLILNSMSMEDVTMGENGIEDADSFIANTKAKYPSCFGTVTEEGTPEINPMGGNPPQKLTMAQIKNMSPEEINKNWDAVQRTLAAQK